ncbi:MAG: helix-turn-helix transcriptional regulator [Clostridia bacterium]|nr:helix-turn-helix transcriptional regulator [Clostridia bacterium]
MNIEIANRLVQLRKEHGYSQETLAAALGLSRQAISKWERGESSPDLDNILELSRVYGITLDALLKGEAAVPSPETEAALPAEETPEVTYDRARAEHVQAKEAYEQAEAAYFRSGFAKASHAQAETEEAQADIPDFEEEDDDEQERCGKWSAFPFVLAPAMLYLLFGFLFGWWLKGCILFLTIPLYYSIANWVDGGRKGSILRAIPYPVVAVMVYLSIGLIANVWHPTWLIFLTIPVYDAAVGYILREK